jgi:hypothetical protein
LAHDPVRFVPIFIYITAIKNVYIIIQFVGFTKACVAKVVKRKNRIGY